MTELPAEEDFAQHLHTKFRVRTEDALEAELELDEVVGYSRGPNEQDGMVRFSVFFQSPANLMLQQGTFTLEHEQMGSLMVFLVPIALNERGFRYEAIFNYFKESDKKNS